MQFMEQNNLKNKIEIRIHLLDYNKLKCIEIRQMIKTPELIKRILEAAFEEKSIEVCPRFYNKIVAINKLKEAGIVKVDRNSYEFLI